MWVVLSDLLGLSRRYNRLRADIRRELERLGEVFSRLRDANLKLKPSKCFLCQRNVEFLGHVVSEKGLAMQPSKIEAINEWKACRDVSEVRAFMGLSGYYRRFIKDFSIIAAPLYGLTRKDGEFKWTQGCQEAFDELKRRLVSEPILALPSDEGTYVLDTDASDFGLGAVLSQRQGEQEKVIAYASRTLGKPEQKYETTRKELLAIVTGLKQFCQYLLGRHFVIRTDHTALTWLRRAAEPMPQLARWLTFIEQFDYEIEHRPGTEHSNADGLSRRNPQGIRTIKGKKFRPSTPGLQESSLMERQLKDAEIGSFVSMRLALDRLPGREELQMESELTKQLASHWSQFEVHDGLVYRRCQDTPKGEGDYTYAAVASTHRCPGCSEAMSWRYGGRTLRRTEDDGPDQTLLLLEPVEGRCKPFLSAVLSMQSISSWQTSEARSIATGCPWCTLRTMVHRSHWTTSEI